MTRTRALRPLQVFERNMDDAHQLIELARALCNSRQNRLQTRRQETIGQALKFPKRQWPRLDCVESDDLFMILKPGRLTRAQFTDHALQPLLRQSVVAAGAAVEAFVAEWAEDLVGQALARQPLPKRLAEKALTMGEVLEIERKHERRGWGYRRLLIRQLHREASSSPSEIGKLFSTVGVDGLWPKVDRQRRVAAGTSSAELDVLSKRRNQIAHSADRRGARTAAITVKSIERMTDQAREIVEAMDVVLGEAAA